MTKQYDVTSIRLERTTRNLLWLAKHKGSSQLREGRKSIPESKQASEARFPKGEKLENRSVSARDKSLIEVAEVDRSTNDKARQKGRKPRAAVVSWDLAHNPVGRALVLYRLLEEDYEVDLVGPIWSRFGSELWDPLQDLDLRIRQFHCNDVMDFVPKAEFVASCKTYDLVYVCKPRLPSLFIGKLISENSNCPLVVDVDDFELAFFKNDNEASVEEIRGNLQAALREPYEELATRYCQSIISDADAITVSNIALQKKFGGQIIRHARDEFEFRYSATLRERGRAWLGVENASFLILFVGTPRSHKGVAEVARIVYELNDPTVVFHVVGTINDSGFRAKLSEYDCPQIVFHDNTDISILPDLIAAADLVPLVQDVSHPISQYQIPAKVSDATAMGVPVLCTSTPPLADLISSVGILQTSVRTLKKDVKRCISTGLSDRVREDTRLLFCREFGLEVNRARLKVVIKDIDKTVAKSNDRIVEMVELVRESYANEREREQKSEKEIQSVIENSTRKLEKNKDRLKGVVFKSRSERVFNDYCVVSAGDTDADSSGWFKRTLKNTLSGLQRTRRKHQYDIAFFWKQNDSGIYGRRSDMLSKYLTASDRVRSVIHFDAPISLKTIDQRIEESDKLLSNEFLSQQQLIVRNLYDRQIGIFDTNKRHDRTYIIDESQTSSNFPGRFGRRDETYTDYVRRCLSENGMSPETTIAWFCPIVWEAPELVQEVGFSNIISDLIDDQRAWATRSEAYSEKIEKSYSDTLEFSDLVFANCESLANAFSNNTDEIYVVPNGAECLLDLPKPSSGRFSFSDRPKIGYVGNLRDRIDWELLHKVVTELTDYQFIFMGPANESENALQLEKHNNVRMLGVVPYNEMIRYLGEIDVAMVPHLRNSLTEKMNPLKVYNYFAAGLPVVSTDIANLGLIGPSLYKANNAEEFINQIVAAVSSPVDTNSALWKSAMQNISWSDRVSKIIDVMDKSLGDDYASNLSRERSRDLAA